MPNISFNSTHNHNTANEANTTGATGLGMTAAVIGACPLGHANCQVTGMVTTPILLCDIYAPVVSTNEAQQTGNIRINPAHTHTAALKQRNTSATCRYITHTNCPLAHLACLNAAAGTFTGVKTTNPYVSPFAAYQQSGNIKVNISHLHSYPYLLGPFNTTDAMVACPSGHATCQAGVARSFLAWLAGNHNSTNSGYV